MMAFYNAFPCLATSFPYVALRKRPNECLQQIYPSYANLSNIHRLKLRNVDRNSNRRRFGQLFP